MWWWKRKIHISWTLALVCVGFVCGVALALVLRLPFIWACVGFLGILTSLWLSKVYALPCAVIAAVVLGCSYGTAHIVDRGRYVGWIGGVAEIKGRVREDPSRSASGSTSIQLDSVTLNGTPMPGAVFVSVRSAHDVRRGDVVKGTGEIREGFANFPISTSLPSFSSVTRSPFGDVGRVVRDWFADKVRKIVPEPQASLGIGFLTGQKSALPTDLADALKIAGLSHIVVASGYNLTILVRMARKVLVRVSKFLSAVSAALMIACFMAITGLSPSMTRAGLVSSMSLLAWYYGHTFHPIVLLSVVAALTVAFQPSYAWGDLGWQLSFSAFAGVMIVSPLLQAYFFGEKEPGIFRQLLGETVAAHLVTVPIIALSFGIISNVAIIANLLVVPLVPLAMLLTFLCGVMAILSLPFTEILATPTSWLLEYMVKVARMVAEIPWAQSELKFAPILWAGYAAVLIALCWWMYKKTSYSFRGT